MLGMLVDLEVMEKRLFVIAIAIAVIGGIAGTFVGSPIAPFAALFVTGAGAWIGWNCASGDSSKDYAMSAAFLVFLDHKDWGNASAQLEKIPWDLGGYASGIFSEIAGFIIVIAAVGLLKNLMDRAQNSTN
jgi:hypothetical protein